MIQYPMSFQVTSQSAAGVQTVWTTSPEDPKVGMMAALTAAVPPEFEGPGGGYSPEDFYALALANCFVATFKVVAEKSKLEYAAVRTSGVLIVDRDERGVPWMKSFLFQVSLEGVADPERARRILEKTSVSCMVLNSVKTEKKFEFQITP